MGRRAPAVTPGRTTKVRFSGVNTSVSGGHVSPRGPGLQLAGARQPKPGNQIWGARLAQGSLAGRWARGTSAPASGCAHIPPWTSALPSPGVSGLHPHPRRDHIRGRQLMFLLALFPSHLENWSGPASYSFSQPALGEWRGWRGNLRQGPHSAVDTLVPLQIHSQSTQKFCASRSLSNAEARQPEWPVQAGRGLPCSKALSCSPRGHQRLIL